MAKMTTFEQIQTRARKEHEDWIARLTEHFGKMVSAHTGNRHPDEQRKLMNEFVQGLESHFNTRYQRR